MEYSILLSPENENCIFVRMISLYQQREWPLFHASAMLHCNHVTAAAQNENTERWLLPGPFTFFMLM